MTTVVLTVFLKNPKLFRNYFEVLKILNCQKPLNLLRKIFNGHIFFEFFMSKFTGFSKI